MELASAGYLVFAGVRKESDGVALATEAASRGFGNNIFAISVEVTDAGSLADAVEAVKTVLRARFPGRQLAALINNAGVAHVGAIETIAMKDVCTSFVG